MTRRQTGPARGLLWVLFASGALGFHLGYSRYADWQVAVETAQVVAGLVHYPTDNPFYLYHTKLWTALHQIAAMLLRSGVSEIALSRLLSGVLGMLSFQALSTVTYAASRDAFVSIGATAVIFATHAPETGASYPIFMMGVPFTYGIAGLSLAVLILALIGCGAGRAGAFLLGIAPAVHPSLGVWLWLIVGVSCAVDGGVRITLRAALPAFVAGCTVTAVSLGAHLLMASRVPGLRVEVTRSYFDAFVTLWDGHRQPISLAAPAVWLNAGAVALATLWLRLLARQAARRPDSAASVGAPNPHAKGLPGNPARTTNREPRTADDASLLLRLFQVSAAIALALVPLSWIPPEHVPMRLLILMPGRVLNINALAFSALVFGLLASLRGDVRGALLTVLFAGGLLISDTSALWRLVPAGARPAWMPAPHVLSLIVAAAAIAVAVNRRREQTRPGLLVVALRTSSAVPFAIAAVLAYRAADDRSRLFVDRTNDGFFAAVSRDQGVLLGPGEIYLLQLRTRRPVLIDAGALDTLAYTPETGPAMHRILRDVYGVDIFSPPPEARGSGRLPASVHRAAWEGFTVERWREIRRTYYVTNVLTEGDWVLNLPVVAQDRRYLLYRIPD